MFRTSLSRCFASFAALLVFGSICLIPAQAHAASNPCAGIIDDMVDNDKTSKLHGSSSDQTSPLSLDIDAAKVPIANGGYPINTSYVRYVAPTGNDANPGTLAQPQKTLQYVFDHMPASGGTVVLRGGIYQQGGAGTDKSVHIQPYKNEQVWFDGAVTVSSGSFKKTGSTYDAQWDVSSFCGGKFYSVPLKQQLDAAHGNAGPCAHFDNSNDPKNPMAVDPVMVFKDGHYVHEVETAAQATGDKFYYDQTARAVRLGFDPAGHKVEITKYANAMVLAGDKQVVQGVGFKRYGTNEYPGNTTYGALYLAATNGYVKDIAMKQMAGQALFLNARGGHVIHSVFANNGFDGLNSNGHQASDRGVDGLTIEDNLVYNNNTELFGTHSDVSSVRAGSKIAGVNSFTVRNNIFYHNNGYGFWCDSDCTYGMIVKNTVINNERGGLLYEVSSKGMIASNVVVGGSEQGIRVSAADTKIYNNTVIGGSQNSIWLYDDPRTAGNTGRIPDPVGPDSRNIEFMNNIVYNDDNLVKLSTGSKVPNGNRPNNNTTIKELLKAFDYNEYYKTGSNDYAAILDTPSDQLGIHNYSTMSDMRKDLTTTDGKKIDPHAVYLTSSPFVSKGANDYRLKSSDKGYKTATTLPADVAAQLGLTKTTGYNRGAISWPGM